ncbi:hypothetical protein B5K06_09890 [Rhizobium grahamii]|uniref:Uncharacterized protein n=1 Tax=Rhizobium grahamii TaxID=1120045 RepID=A0A370KS94_9HYPH|nr:hypothetical protein B5K06_09890 [Rhizobium grahamii]
MRPGPPNVASAALIRTSGRPGVAYQTEPGDGHRVQEERIGYAPLLDRASTDASRDGRIAVDFKELLASSIKRRMSA